MISFPFSIDRRDILRRYTVFSVGTPECFTVFVHVCNTLLHFYIFEEYLFVTVPGTLFFTVFGRFPFGPERRYVNGKCSLLELHMGKKSVQIGTLEMIMPDHPVYEYLYFTFPGIVLRQHRRGKDRSPVFNSSFVT